ncbi:MAG: sodium:proton antiporter [Oscillospiraceae bacterium]|nr:sodium:proton antiporter [Oscillospiraceae bacterium]
MNGLIYTLVFMPIVCAFLSYILGRKTKTGRNIFFCAVAALEFVLALVLFIVGQGTETSVTIPGICGMGLNFVSGGFRSIYALIACFMWMITALYSPEYFAHYRNRNRYYLFQLLTLGATVAIFLSADLYTTFVFFEIMSLASYVWVAQDEKAESMKAASTYIAVAVIGGLVMLMGLFLLYNQAGTLVIDELRSACEGKKLYAAAICMFVGFAAKAGAYPIHIWLPKAHPVAPAPASALLSGILTKTGIYGIIIISCRILMHDENWGAFVLIIGVITMFLGALLALFSVNFKRTLACSSVSQIGFILVGVGMLVLSGEANFLAVQGTFLHMVNHSLFKLILFLVAAGIYMNTHKLELNDIRGFGRGKSGLMIPYLLGALGIGGIPLFSGYVSKTLLHESIVEYIHELHEGTVVSTIFSAGGMKAIEWIFLVSGGITLAYMTKLFIAVFVEKNNDKKVQEKYDAKKPCMKKVSAIALIAAAVIVPVMGLMPHAVMGNLANMAHSFFDELHHAHHVNFFAWANLKGALISLVIGAVLYLVVVRKWMMKKSADGKTVYVDRWPKFIDLEEKLYRPVIEIALPFVLGNICKVLDKLGDALIRLVKALGGTVAAIIGGATDVVANALPRIGAFFAGVLDTLTDGLVVFLRKTVYRDAKEPVELEEGNMLTHIIGSFLNWIEGILNKTIWKNHEHTKDLEHRFVLRYTYFKENTSVIGRSLTYGLVIFCLGLCITLIYLLFSSVI